MIFSKIKYFFQHTSKKSENISTFSDALIWLKTCQKTGDFHTAMIAAKELILKSQTGITYYEHAKQKIMVLENSNIETISMAAKKKHKKIDDILIGLYKEINSIEKISHQIEKQYLENKKKKDIIEKKQQFKIHIKEFDTFLHKKMYTDALLLAKKLVSEFPNEKWGLRMLTKAQKFYDKEKIKQTDREIRDEKLNNMLAEVWVAREI